MQNDYYTTYLPITSDDDEGGLPKPRFTVQELMQQLVSHNEAITGDDLFVLSDLSRQDAAFVRQEWPLIAKEQRQALDVLQNVEVPVILALNKIDKINKKEKLSFI